VFGNVEHGDAAALGGGEIVQGDDLFIGVDRFRYFALKPVSGNSINGLSSSRSCLSTVQGRLVFR
jgi:hypothetical protein